ARLRRKNPVPPPVGPPAAPELRPFSAVLPAPDRASFPRLSQILPPSPPRRPAPGFPTLDLAIDRGTCVGSLTLATLVGLSPAKSRSTALRLNSGSYFRDRPLDDTFFATFASIH